MLNRPLCFLRHDCYHGIRGPGCPLMKFQIPIPLPKICRKNIGQAYRHKDKKIWVVPRRFEKVKSARITIDLGDPKLLEMLKLEAQLTHSTVREVMVRVLEAFLSNKKELHDLHILSSKSFAEWDDSRDADYDKL